jgi:NADP-dependent aldehyde dehydrogenase
VGPHAVRRWCRPVAFQNFPDALLPAELQENNPRRIVRQVDGAFVSFSGL